MCLITAHEHIFHTLLSSLFDPIHYSGPPAISHSLTALHEMMLYIIYFLASCLIILFRCHCVAVRVENKFLSVTAFHSFTVSHLSRSSLLYTAIYILVYIYIAFPICIILVSRSLTEALAGPDPVVSQ